MQTRLLTIAAATALSTTMAAHSAFAQQVQVPRVGAPEQVPDQAIQAQQDQPAIISPNEWNYEALYTGGFRGEQLLDADVYGAEGAEANEEIGDVENVILDQNNRIIAVIAEVGGFWDIGDTHVAVPWEQVTLLQDGVRVPVNEENVEEYGLFRDHSYFTLEDAQQTRVVDDDLTTGPRSWKLSDLIDDFAVLRDGQSYGYVDDVIFDRQGQLQAVVVEPDVAYGARGPYAYPFYGYNVGWDPGYDYYQLPYTEQEVAGFEPFQYEAMQNDVLVD